MEEGTTGTIGHVPWKEERTVTQRSPAPDWFRRVGTVPQLHFGKNRGVALPFTFLRHVHIALSLLIFVFFLVFVFISSSSSSSHPPCRDLGSASRLLMHSCFLKPGTSLRFATGVERFAAELLPRPLASARNGTDGTVPCEH